MWYNVSARWTVNTDKFTLFVYCNFLALLSTTVCSQNINKQNVNIADETLTDYSFHSRYHCTKSKNYLKRRYRIHWIPMYFGTPCMFTFCLFMFWLHTVVLSKTIKLQRKQRKLVRLHCSSCRDIIATSLQSFTLFIK